MCLELFSVAAILFFVWFNWSPSRRIAWRYSKSFDRWYAMEMKTGRKIQIIRNPNSIIVMVHRRHEWKYQNGYWYSADFCGRWCCIVGCI